MNKDLISININTPNLTIEALTIRKGNRVQFVLKNNSNAKYELKSMELKLFDANKNYIGHELCFTEQADDFIDKNQELLLEFSPIELNDIGSAELKIVSERWFKLINLLFILAIIGFFILVIILRKTN